MAIDVERERIVPLQGASKYIPGRPHLATVYRWATRAENPLETIKAGARLYTSVEAIHRFIARCTNPAEAPQPVTTGARERAVEKELAEAGI